MLVGEVSWVGYLVGFLVPAVLGNIVGGVCLVSLLNYGQVKGSKRKTHFAGYFDPNNENSENNQKEQ